MSEKQIELKKYVEQIEELSSISPHIMAVSNLLSEKNIVTEEEFYKEIKKFVKEQRETVASK
ncbi:hypothetical protein L2D08_12930 [Domibacillus sp. PGB-M46]|uniref:hypothetical protein n=1 Tax=Domibacillus sp. PGB-M46 TaxID=2910255 RepID=UPI001F5A79D8|nr:hypothetical protein [Domibacillus sp. PGB-M46]MCI2255272.1 hypothetical protein [Domibacillus sp. PGB-M46]